MYPENDRRPLLLAAVIALSGILLTSTGVVRSPFRHLTQAGLGGDHFVVFFGFIGWYYVLMYTFAMPGLRKLAQLWVPGLIAVAIAYFALVLPAYSHSNQYILVFGLLGSVIGLLALLQVLYDCRYSKVDSDRNRANAMRFTFGAIALIVWMPDVYLDLTMSIHPTTFDLPLYHFESTMGFLPSATLGLIAEASPGFKSVISTAYNMMVLGYGALFGAQLARPNRPSINLLAAWVISACIALIGYHLLPASGPKYLFHELFPISMPPIDVLPQEPIVINPAPRNAVPSMHFGWALMLWLNASLLRAPLLRAGFAILLGLNIIATMALGEHYFVDLVIAVPVIVMVQAICMTALPWRHALRRRAIVWGLGLWLAWVMALRFGIPVFKAVPGLSWLAMVATVGASIWLYKPLARAFVMAWTTAKESRSPAISVLKPASGAGVRVVAAMFVLSGFAGLMYEVLFSKALALTFGSTATATYTVLATYMGGMAIGSWLGGRLASGRDNPLAFYAFCELGIGVYCVATPAIFTGIQALYVSLAAGVVPDAGVLTLFRFSLGVVALLVPTVLMGMTLPILVRFFEKNSHTLGRSVAVLYGANTLGAALGALMAGYFVIPMLGVHRTTLAAALLNLLVALMAIELHKKTLARQQENLPQCVPEIGMSDIVPAVGQDMAGIRRLGYLALAILGVGGIVTLAIEINYIHLLAVIAGNSTYAFSLMLFTFLLGLGVGAEVARRLLKHDWPLGLMLGWLECGLAIVILSGVFFWGQMPDYFASFASYPLTKEFGAREVVRGLVCWLAMFPPALFIGAIYPVAMECIGQDSAGWPIRALGRAAALNTLGNIVGVLLGGFILLPYLGALRSVQLLAAVCIVLGTIALLRSGRGRKPITWVPAAAVAMLFAIQPASFDYTKLASGANVYFQPQGWGEIIDHAESIDGGLTSVALRDRPGEVPLRTLLTNGKFQGNDSKVGEMQAQLGFSLSPLMHTAHRDRALVIGYGTGVSTRTLHEAGFNQLDMVDLSADIVRLANQYFDSVNGRATEQPGVNTYITDGRNFLMLQDRKYDVIGMEISSIWFAGAANLYNREFYQLVKQRLQPHGVLQQWMQLHHLGNLDVLRILGSVRAEFKYVWLYEIGGQGIIIASNDPAAVPKRENIDLLQRTPTLQPLLAILKDDPVKLLDTQLLNPQGMDRLLSDFEAPASYWVSTDDNLYLEYSTPKGNTYDGPASVLSNKKFIAEHSAKKRDAVAAGGEKKLLD